MMKTSGKTTSSGKPLTIRARAGSTPGLDSQQIHQIMTNRNNALTRILCKDAGTVDSPTPPTLPPSRSSSVFSMASSRSVDTIGSSSGRLIKVAPAKVRAPSASSSSSSGSSTSSTKSRISWTDICRSHDTVSIMSDETVSSFSSNEPSTPRPTSLSNKEEFKEQQPAQVEPDSPYDDASDEIFERVKRPQTPSTEPPKPEVPPARSLMPLRSLYLDEIVWQIDDRVFASAIEAVNNNSLMCRLNIEFICEIADENADHVQESRRQNRGFDCPCFCNKTSSHFRYYLSFSLPETEQKCMQLSEDTKLNDMFQEFIDLVQRARKANRNVLVCSTRGRNRAPAFASAYLMNKEKIPRHRAVGIVREKMGTMRPPVNISDFMQRKLMRYQQHLGIDLSNAYDDKHTLPLFHTKRSAWT